MIISDPKRPVRPALGTAGLALVFLETAGPSYDTGLRLSKTKAGRDLGHPQASSHER